VLAIQVRIKPTGRAGAAAGRAHSCSIALSSLSLNHPCSSALATRSG
jgi:hypothetical protein